MGRLNLFTAHEAMQNPALLKVCLEAGVDAPQPYEAAQADWDTLHQRRGQFKSIMGAMLAKAKADDRGFSDDENQAWDHLETTLDWYTEEIDVRARAGHKEPDPERAQMAADAAYKAGHGGRVNPGRVTRLGGGDKNIIRPLAAADKLADWASRHEPGYFSGDHGTVDGFVRAMITGDWDRHYPQAAAHGIAPGSAGGYLVPAPLAAQIIDLARAQSRAVQLGASTIPMESNTLRIVRIESDPTPTWRAEHYPIPESSGTFGAVDFTAKTLGCIVRTSVELMEDSSPLRFGSVIEQMLAKALALELDRACFFGSGSGQIPQGIYYNGSVPKTTLAGALTDYDPLSAAVQAVMEQNLEPGDFLTSPRVWGELDRLKDAEDRPLLPPPSVSSRRILTSTSVPVDLEYGSPATGDASAIITGLWNSLLIGMRAQIRLEAAGAGGWLDDDPVGSGSGDAFSRYQVRLRAVLRADVKLARATDFYVIDGITAPV